MRTDVSVVKLPRVLINRVKDRRRPGQAIRGVIEELLEQAHTYTDNPDTLARLERYRTHPRETQDDLITNVLDQLEELEKQLIKKTETK